MKGIKKSASSFIVGFAGLALINLSESGIEFLENG